MNEATDIETAPGRTSLKGKEIASQLREAIIAGSYGNGALLPGENELAHKFAVSRGTIRRALQGLAQDRLIHTQSGVGSFVTFDGHQLSASSSWGSALAVSGVRVQTEILRMERIVDPELAAGVGSSSIEFLALDRVRHVVDGRAVSIERSRVPAIGAVGAAPEKGLIDGSLSATMAEAGLITHSGEQWISVAPLGDADARTLGRVPGDLFLHSIRIARDLDGNFVEKVVSWLDPDRFRLHMNFGA
ncbi:GntR family transcriptional regulator [Glaciibacter superstes]|uniref:GntR family transcriptional regulator n=1 Tax=Glaciibacter superstes TaxID=501023 RepID=UPI0003B57557|nr:GntR family transcriptional regulator [Glaciibacter superstes]